MSWTARLSHPIALDNGEVLLTLRDARKFILALPEQHRNYAKMKRVASVLLVAAQIDRPDIIAIATEQLRRALMTRPFPPVRLAEDTPPNNPAAPSVTRRRPRSRKPS